MKSGANQAVLWKLLSVFALFAQIACSQVAYVPPSSQQKNLVNAEDLPSLDDEGGGPVITNPGTTTEPTPAPTAAPTATPVATATPVPTATPMATATPVPSPTPVTKPQGAVPAEMRSCDGAATLTSGQTACWGWWDQLNCGDQTNDLDPRMCGTNGVYNGADYPDFSAASTGCFIAASKCQSGFAFAATYEAPNDGCIHKKWTYVCY